MNQVYEMDQFVGDLIKAVEARKEPSVVVFYGDHLPTMGLKAEDLKSRYLYNTNYVIWDNVGLQKQDKNIPAYQLMSEILNRLDIHSGTVFNYLSREKERRIIFQTWNFCSMIFCMESSTFITIILRSRKGIW